MSGTRGTLRRFMRFAGLGEAPTSDRRYRCNGCESEFDLQYHVCPECGSFSVEPAEEPLI